ncbi:MAG: response regulator transcription factor [Rhodospirillum sp.]|nr:response regulator transcription factor [Rhodospirillum sp.]MCF8488311.1 response regulator transcription factor [Rhodospirillum sp.]MCF8502901.1 response regulator transcription factor [Rhodospirillum sp.]
MDSKAAPRILVVEDDPGISSLLADALTANGMAPTVAPDGRVMDTHLREADFDLILLDVMLPGEDGIGICRRLRADRTIPIIMLTSLGEEVDRVVGLEMGADDYVTKPFSTREVLARIRGLLRRASYLPVRRDPRTKLRFLGWSLDPLRRVLHDPENTRVTLTATQFDLLLAFCRNPGKVISREELMTLTHAGLAGPIERSIDVHVSRIRQKIEPDPKEPTILKTVRLGGYLFAAEVTEA